MLTKGHFLELCQEKGTPEGHFKNLDEERDTPEPPIIVPKLFLIGWYELCHL